MVIAITGIIGAMVAVFIKSPVEGYFDAARRAELTDAADTATRRIGRDLKLALPNSVRVSPDGLAIEFLSTRTGGRYRTDVDGAGAGNILDFTAPNEPDSSFDILGPPINFAGGDQIVIYNLGIDGATAYAGENRRTYSGTAGMQSTVSFTPSTAFPFDSPNHSFYVVDTPVTFICDPTARTLTRYWGYPIPSGATITSAPPSVAPPTASRGQALLAQNVACNFAYEPGVTERSGLVVMRLSINQNSETVSLYHEVHINNVP